MLACKLSPVQEHVRINYSVLFSHLLLNLTIARELAWKSDLKNERMQVLIDYLANNKIHNDVRVNLAIELAARHHFNDEQFTFLFFF